LRYLITGHTGFKGSWLAAKLKIEGHKVFGISLNPPKKSLFNLAEVSQYMDRDIRVDIRNVKSLEKAILKLNPEVIVHLAAQSLVLESYRNPIYTYETNVIGTLNLLNSSVRADELKAILIITSDKVYKKKTTKEAFVESDPLGGDDPYSSSKAAKDIVTQAWRTSFGRIPIAIARSGNVIGGGDWSTDRIIPDLVNSLTEGKELLVRNLYSVRPWQHVLDCLNGYQLLIKQQLEMGLQGEWNFGPGPNSNFTVNDLIENFCQAWGKDVKIKIVPRQVKELESLSIDSNHSRLNLGWTEKLNFRKTLDWTSEWYKDSNPAVKTKNQIIQFINL
jgi:CDP-glucose 4,6-dehydratase